jgi:AcrR family transcriptional regulator
MVHEAASSPSPGPSLRERRRQETAELILDAVLDLVAEAGIDGLTMEAVAERVGVSLRTVYRYFPDRASLLTAALGRHNEAVPFESPTSPDQIGAAYGEVFSRFDDAPAIVQAVLAARVAGSVRWDARAKRIREIEEALAPACDHLPRQEAEQATAVIVYLANALAWLSLRDESGLDGQRSGAAITWAIDTLVADLARRNRRSASTPSQTQR